MDGAILQMVNHGLITGALFLLVGVIYERTHDRTIAKMGGLAGAHAGLRRRRSASSSSPRPGCRACPGFVGEFLSLVGAFVFSPWVAAVATFCMILAAAYLLWMFQRVVLRRAVRRSCTGLGHHLTDMTPTEILTLAPLAALVVVFGLFPGLLLDLIERLGRERPRATSARGTRDRDRPADRSRSARARSPIAYVVAPADLRCGPGRPPGARRARSTPVEGAASMTGHDLVVDRAAHRRRSASRSRSSSSTSSLPGRPRRRSIVVALVGLAIVGGRDARDRRRHDGDRDDGVRRRLRGRRADDVPRPAVHLDRRVDDRVRARTTSSRAACRVAEFAVVLRLRDDRGDADRGLGGPAAAVPRPRAHGPARLHARRLPQDRRLLDRGRDQVLPPRLVQLGDLPVRPGVRLGPDRHDAHRRRRERAAGRRDGTLRVLARASRWASRS